jgi:hypothetical protein
MPSEFPLDDLIGRSFYIDGAPWRLAYNRAVRAFALRRVASEIPLDEALEQIAAGELLWNPPDQFEPLGPDVAVAVVQQHIALLNAFSRSLARVESTNWALRARIDERLAEARSWLARRALKSGDATEQAGSGGE